MKLDWEKVPSAMDGKNPWFYYASDADNNRWIVTWSRRLNSNIVLLNGNFCCTATSYADGKAFCESADINPVLQHMLAQ